MLISVWGHSKFRVRTTFTLSFMVQYSEFNEPVIELYMDLDEFLSKIKIDYNEKNIVSLQFYYKKNWIFKLNFCLGSAKCSEFRIISQMNWKSIIERRKIFWRKKRRRKNTWIIIIIISICIMIRISQLISFIKYTHTHKFKIKKNEARARKTCSFNYFFNWSLSTFYIINFNHA